MEQPQYNSLFPFVWTIANDVPVNAFDKGDYRKIILHVPVIRRIDVLLEASKDAVLQMKEQLDNSRMETQDPILYEVTGYPFYNTSKCAMKTLKSEIDPLRLELDFTEYLNSCSKGVRNIIEKLRLRQVVDDLSETARHLKSCLRNLLDNFLRNCLNFCHKKRNLNNFQTDSKHFLKN